LETIQTGTTHSKSAKIFPINKLKYFFNTYQINRNGQKLSHSTITDRYDLAKTERSRYNSA